MTELVFATNNPHKIEEIMYAVGDYVKILSLAEIGCNEDIPETANTLEGNATLKSHYIYDTYHRNCFADDTGLEIDALDGRPGVYSARYAGPEHDHLKNIEKVLKELKGIHNRKARFRTVISLLIEGQELTFEGIVEGVITEKKSGSSGFGYDPVFRPDGFNKTFAEMDIETKNRISHRGKAVRKLIAYLRNL